MKNILLRIAAVFAFVSVLAVSVTVGAAQVRADTYTGACGAEESTLTWTFDPSNGALTVSGEGDMEDYTDPALVPWSEYRTDIISVSIDEGVTSIGSFAFFRCTSLAAVSIGDDVTYIGNRAFFSCTSLSSMIIPSSVTELGASLFYLSQTSDTQLETDQLVGAELRMLVYKDSSAYEYAVDNGIDYKIYSDTEGDLDGDGMLTNSDIALAVRYVSGWTIDGYEGLIDLSGDGKINNRDLVKMIQRLVG